MHTNYREGTSRDLKMINEPRYSYTNGKGSNFRNTISDIDIELYVELLLLRVGYSVSPLQAHRPCRVNSFEDVSR